MYQYNNPANPMYTTSTTNTSKLRMSTTILLELPLALRDPSITLSHLPLELVTLSPEPLGLRPAQTQLTSPTHRQLPPSVGRPPYPTMNVSSDLQNTIISLIIVLYYKKLN
ncbi:hypothetical protein RND81_08G034900 [Saponaria officinalis]|uniref:Uncharacterized protein n=1 Tax=Saponaria officinalis TaxID=3572 RepID=A0AAW1J2V7_SAPOF